MNFSTTQYHLFAEACRSPQGAYHWHFKLDATNGSLRLDVTEEEPGASLDRLELWAVVRGLEALDQPSRVTLLTPSRYVNHGLRYGLQEWRQTGWQTESFGQMAPIKNEDLWKRIDQAAAIHRVHCRLWRADEAVSAVPEPAFARRRRNAKRAAISRREQADVAESRTPWLSLRQRVAGALMGLGQVIAPSGVSAVAG